MTTWKSTVAAVEATRMDGTALAKAVAVTRPEDPVDVTRCATRNT